MVIDEIKNNTPSADKLWQEHEPYIRELCNYKLSSHEEYIDDCVQDVFVALVEALHKGTAIEYPKAWLTTVADNMIIDIYKQSSRDKEKLLPFTEENIDVRIQGTIDYNYLNEEDIDKYLSQIIDNLTEYEQCLFKDFYLRHIKQSELAKARCITENLIQQQVFRLKRKIIKIIRKLFS